MRITPRILVFVCATSLSLAASASTVTGGGGGFTGSGTFTTTANGDGSYTITALTGDANSGIGALIAVKGFNNNDNQLYPSNPSLVDSSGFSFTDAQGNTSFQVDIFSTTPGNYSAYLVDSDVFSETIPVTFTLTSPPTPALTAAFSPLATQRVFDFTIQQAAVAPTPEPSSLVLLGTGLLAACGATRRRFNL